MEELCSVSDPVLWADLCERYVSKYNRLPDSTLTRSQALELNDDIILEEWRGAF